MLFFDEQEEDASLLMIFSSAVVNLCMAPVIPVLPASAVERASSLLFALACF